MSVMLCSICLTATDTDADPDSLYIRKGDAVCVWCRQDQGLEINYELYLPAYPWGGGSGREEAE